MLLLLPYVSMIRKDYVESNTSIDLLMQMIIMIYSNPNYLCDVFCLYSASLAEHHQTFSQIQIYIIKTPKQLIFFICFPIYWTVDCRLFTCRPNSLIQITAANVFFFDLNCGLLTIVQRIEIRIECSCSGPHMKNRIYINKQLDSNVHSILHIILAGGRHRNQISKKEKEKKFKPIRVNSTAAC